MIIGLTVCIFVNHVTIVCEQRKIGARPYLNFYFLQKQQETIFSKILMKINRVCTVCHRWMFKKSVKDFSSSNFDIGDIFVKYICITCHNTGGSHLKPDFWEHENLSSLSVIWLTGTNLH